MSETDAPKRGSARKNVTLAMSMDLYELIKQRAEDSGRSLSREIELSLDKIYSGAVDATVQQAISEATDAARDAAYKDLEEEFGGDLSMHFLGIFADAFNAELRKATAEDADYKDLFTNEKRRKEFTQSLSEHLPGTVKAIGGYFMFGDLLGSLRGQIEMLKKNDPAEFNKMMSELNQTGLGRSFRGLKK